MLLHSAQAQGPNVEDDPLIAEQTPSPTPEPTLPPYVIPADLTAHAVADTQPENLILETAVEVDGERVENYTPSREIFFGGETDYTDILGIPGFRGGNYRQGAAYGTVDWDGKTLKNTWSVNTGSLTAPDGNAWTGSGWTGQPLIVEWDVETQRNMNLYDWAKNTPGLKEVIYACMDGYVYFIDLESGEKTRDPLNIGYTFKGTPALDPRGYPLLYLGSGYHSNRGNSRAFVVSLIDGEILYTYGNGDRFALRDWSMFDASPLIDAKTDTLIHPGENGVLYLIHLNSKYDPITGAVSVDPDEVVKWRYKSTRNGSQYWLGMEDSPVVWNGYIIMADNGGQLMCLDLNTLELVWVQDVLDDTNCTPVLDVENGHPYVYISTSFHEGWRSWTTATIPVWKIDAVTGEVVWQTDYTCCTESGVSGGVQGTIAVGKGDCADRVFVPVSKTPNVSAGVLAALDKKTGEKLWEFPTKMYSWSSPVDFYDSNGKCYVAYTTFGGYLYILDGQTGEQLASLDLGGKVEASPAVYNGHLVVGLRSCKILGIDLT
ncbi:MAG: PQQ-binding-like beta-propeller repeat protein [Oscillospiraceae bacterium]|nr:PQQ-binding-like beta-propeller repeat protein [Oscillospiraceae bacterium]